MKQNVLALLLDEIIEGRKVSTDSRTIQKGDLFFALKGEQFDGNTKAVEALEKGAYLAVVDSKVHAINEKYLLVDDGLKMLQMLALKYRQHLNIPTLAITGSNGKTTTKELITKVLECRYHVHSTKGNLNNHIGVPLSILSADSRADLLVIEMGANQFGDIEELCMIADPDHGLISNIGAAHLEKLRDLNGVFDEKTSLYRHIKTKKGVFFLNCSDPFLERLQGDYDHSICYTSDQCLGVEIDAMMLGRGEFQAYRITYGNESFVLHSKLIGAHNQMNISATICVGLYFKIEIKEIVEALASYTPENMRSQWLQTKRNSLILDAYNANPSSMKEAIKSFVSNKYEKPVMILGDMLELGVSSTQFHQELIDLVGEIFHGTVILVGKEFSLIKTSFLRFENVTALVKSGLLDSFNGATILIKASRGIRLEQIKESL